MLDGGMEEAGALASRSSSTWSTLFAFFQPVDRTTNASKSCCFTLRTLGQQGGVTEFHRTHRFLRAPRRIASWDALRGCARALRREPRAACRKCSIAIATSSSTSPGSPFVLVVLQLGRQPAAARALLMKIRIRVLFGTDVFPLRAGIFHVNFRLFETPTSLPPTPTTPVPGSGRGPSTASTCPTPCSSRSTGTTLPAAGDCRRPVPKSGRSRSAPPSSRI